MAKLVLIRPGTTDFDEQGRIKGTLDIPLSADGTEQVKKVAAEVAPLKIDYLYTSPCRCAEQTAAVVAARTGLRPRVLEDLQNLDHGLWHGKLIDEVRLSQPKVFRQMQEHPETVCPPEGEPCNEARTRAERAVDKLLQKHRTGTVAVIIPEPLASLVQSTLEKGVLGDLWKAQCAPAGWWLFEKNVPATSLWRGARGA